MHSPDKLSRAPNITKGKRQFAHGLEVKERRAHAFRLRVTGASYSRIATAMRTDPAWQGRLPRMYDDRAVYRDIQREVQRRDAEMTIDINLVRQAELDLLDQLQLAIIGRALGTPANLAAGLPAQPPDLAAQQQILRIMERRAKYIPGVNAPLAIAPVTPDGTESYQGNPQQTFFTELVMLFAQYGQEHSVVVSENKDTHSEEQ